MKKETKKKLKIAALIVGGIVLIGGIAYRLSKLKDVKDLGVLAKDKIKLLSGENEACFLKKGLIMINKSNGKQMFIRIPEMLNPMSGKGTILKIRPGQEINYQVIEKLGGLRKIVTGAKTLKGTIKLVGI